MNKVYVMYITHTCTYICIYKDNIYIYIYYIYILSLYSYITYMHSQYLNVQIHCMLLIFCQATLPLPPLVGIVVFASSRRCHVRGRWRHVCVGHHGAGGRHLHEEFIDSCVECMGVNMRMVEPYSGAYYSCFLYMHVHPPASRVPR